MTNWTTAVRRRAYDFQHLGIGVDGHLATALLGFNFYRLDIHAFIGALSAWDSFGILPLSPKTCLKFAMNRM